MPDDTVRNPLFARVYTWLSRKEPEEVVAHRREHRLRREQQRRPDAHRTGPVGAIPGAGLLAPRTSVPTRSIPVNSLRLMTSIGSQDAPCW